MGDRKFGTNEGKEWVTERPEKWSKEWATEWLNIWA